MTSLPSLAYFIAAWPFAAIAVHFSDRDDAYLTLALFSGPLLVMAGVRMLRDPDDPWLRLMGFFRGPIPRDSLALRGFAAATLLALGLVFFGAGVVGAADLLTT